MTDIRLEGENPGNATSGVFVDIGKRPPNAPEGSLVARAPGDAPDHSGTEVNLPGRYVLFVIAGVLVAVFWMAGVLAFSIGQSGLAGLIALPVTGAEIGRAHV